MYSDNTVSIRSLESVWEFVYEESYSRRLSCFELLAYHGSAFVYEEQENGDLKRLGALEDFY